MKNWLRKKPLSSSTSPSAYGLPMSWVFNKLKQKGKEKRQEGSRNHHCISRLEQSSQDRYCGRGDAEAKTSKSGGTKNSHHREAYQTIIQRKQRNACADDQPSNSKKQGKVRVRSREACKIKALQNMKKAHSNNNKKTTTEKKKEERRSSSECVTTAGGMESFAVVKHSQDPHQDFRDSMMDMIMDKGLRKPEQMEELLASYLTLNADHYHGLIVNVFKQVWHELDDVCALNHQLQHLNMVLHD